MENIKSLPHYQFVTVNFKQKHKILTSSIIMFEGHKNYTLIHLSNGLKKMYARTLCHFEEQLMDEKFIRVHRAYLVNPDYIVGYDKVGCKLFLKNYLVASISRRKHQNLDYLFLQTEMSSN